jgi:2-polyprenyl-3-methyl-5-hydroxy-6-metoxy-1,4-benzoquinol methylase
MSEYNTGNDKKRLQESRQYWDDLASSFDDEPDHGLRDSLVLEAWTELLKTWIPAANATILDIGCGTGSLSVILARLGHTVTGIDLSPSMISLARTKAAAYGLEIEFHIMDASHAQLAEHQFDVILCRHLLWALPEPEQVLQRWIKLLKPGGRLILIEGYWRTGAGLHAEEITEMLPSSFINISVRNLSNDPDFWGGTVTDERYIIIADLDQKASHATENMNNES